MRVVRILVGAIALAAVPAPARAQLLNVPVAQWVAQQIVTLDASGNATWTFDPTNRPPVVPAVVHLPKAMDTTNPIICNFTAVSTSAVTVHCWRTTLLGLLNSLFTGSVTGAQVNLVARAIP